MKRGSSNKRDRGLNETKSTLNGVFAIPDSNQLSLVGSRIDPSCSIDHAGVHFRPVPSPERLRGACAADVERCRLTPVCRGSKCRLHRFGWFSSHTTASQRRSHPFAVIPCPPLITSREIRRGASTRVDVNDAVLGRVVVCCDRGVA